MLGGLIGTGAEHAMDDTKAFEYIVRQDNKQLVSVTQKDDTPLAIGQHVLVIAGNQARIVPDYTVQVPDAEAEKAKADAAKAEAAKADKPADAVGGAPADAPKDAAAPSSGSPPAATKPADSTILPSSAKLPDGSVTLPSDTAAPASTNSGSTGSALGTLAGKVFTTPSASVPSSAVPASGIPDVSLDSVGGAVDSVVGK